MVRASKFFKSSKNIFLISVFAMNELCLTTFFIKLQSWLKSFLASLNKVWVAGHKCL